MGDYVEEKERGLLYRAKKNMASMAGDTKLGRKAILTFVGEEGEKLLQTIYEIAELEGGEDRARIVQKDILKLAMKGMLMHDEGILTRDNTFHAVDPVNFLAKKVLSATEKSPADIRGNHELIPSLMANFSRVKDIFVQLVENNMQEKNLNKLKDLFSYIGSRSFLECLLMNEKAVELKQQVSSSLRLLLKFQLEEDEFYTKHAMSK